MREPLAERWRDRLALPDTTPVVSLGEGSTPLVHAPRLSERFELDVWLKCEGANPTGSFKDRGMAIAVAVALGEGRPGVVCASTGNTAASAAAYAARAGLECAIVVPAGGVAPGKLAQARAHGARLIEVEDGFAAALEQAHELAASDGYALVNSVNPFRLQGQKTAAFEIVEELGEPPDALALPYGGGGNTRAYAMGFEELWGALPRLVLGESAERPTTVASAIRITSPPHREEVADAVVRSNGRIVELADVEIVSAREEIAREEGVFCEPASAASVAALAHAGLAPGSRVVCVLTGHGLKDTGA
jgi:threonine synthase